MEIDCRFRIFTWSIIGLRSVYTCRVTSPISIKRPGTEITAFSGIHQRGKTGKDVEGLWISDTNIQFFPKGIEKIFPRLTHLWISNCGLEEIARADLKEFGNLEYLDLSSNKLKMLPDDLLLDMHKLRWISFRDNKIESMSSKLLERVKNNNPIKISFIRNSKIDSYFAKDQHGSLKDLMTEIDQNCAPPPIPMQVVVPSQNISVKVSSCMPAVVWIKKHNQKVWTMKQDFTIKLHGKRYKVHKNILAGQSSVFKKFFTDDPTVSVLKLKVVPNFDKHMFEAFLAFFYTGTVKSANVAIKLLATSVKFDVPDLKSVCEKLIIESLNESKLLVIYNLGCAHSSEVLKKTAFEGIRKLFPILDEDSIDEKKLINDLVETKRRLDELIEAVQPSKRARLI